MLERFSFERLGWQRSPAPLGPADSPPVDTDHLAPPGYARYVELAWRLPRMLSGLGPLCPRGPEDGPPALVIPGFLATDRTTMDLRRALARGGWRVHPWLLGFNRGATKDTMKLLAKRIDAVGEGRKVLVVGWSLGGMFARELAHRCPDKIRGVVTLGSPFSGDLKTNTNVCALYERVAGHDVNKPPFKRYAAKPPVPTLAFWSRKDGIVAPSAARGREDEVDRAVELDVRHAGFAVHRPAMSQIVSGISRFLTEVEGVPPAVPGDRCL
ncbi:alpha/beta hydrolase [Sphingomonas sinipercae]|uniref:Alpha/beta hydrolase n=1 Tax=Sphingomonas sinipercae TaxID=2714944 RepID=A0A6G7ZKE1_9SPHN|nr:alpha/beta fold hydrolase [Sphingomonas sinipercae]QIL01385.1 alpha/beta hydrolase [Sphingomonas sinipercae]